MKLRSLALFFLLFLNSFTSQGQIGNLKEKFELPSEVNETSGLLFYNGKIITHNDSGDNANLYELDSISGNLLRTININNATNVDWEDITEDENHIYIGDIGNNNGTRTDLKIYKILKSDYLNNNSVSAEIISFSYEDQTNFTSSQTHNFDAEALVFYEDSFLIFTKNWGDFKTNVYKIPSSIGTHSAIKVSNANVEGLITGATVSNNNFYLCGSNTSFIPFIIYISFNRAPGDNIFNSGFEKHDLNSGFLYNQVEAITSFDNGKFYVSREAINYASINLSQKLFEFTDSRDYLLSAQKNNLVELTIHPNPTLHKVFIDSNSKIQKISVYNILGKKVNIFQEDINELNLSSLTKGIYLIKIFFENHGIIQRKIIKL